MAVPVSTTVTELPESRVRVQAEVPSEEVEKRVAATARELGRTLRVPGFRAGKAPAPVVIKRIGRQAVLDEAVRDFIGTWYSAAIDAAAIVPVGEPDLDLGDLPRQGEPLKFSIEIGVRPEGDARRVQGAGGRAPRARRRRRGRGRRDRAPARALRPARDGGARRPARRLRRHGLRRHARRRAVRRRRGARPDGRARLRAPRARLRGPAAGRRRPGRSARSPITFPDDYGAPDLAGQAAEFAVTVKEVKAKELPAVDDDLAAEAGFDTLDELREDIRARLREADEQRIEAEFRETVLDAAVAGATVDIPDALVEARSRELWDQMLHSLAHQGISKEMYLRIAGREEEDIVEQGKADAEKQLKREAVLAAVVEAEDVEPSDEEVMETIERAAPAERTSPKKLLDRMRSSGRLDALKAELAQRKALDLLAESAAPISVEQAQARDKLWTPGKEGEARLHRAALDARRLTLSRSPRAAPSSADARIPISTSSTCSASAPLARCGVPSSTARQRSSSPSPRALSVQPGSERELLVRLLAAAQQDGAVEAVRVAAQQRPLAAVDDDAVARRAGGVEARGERAQRRRSRAP